jgi:UDP-3-O-[3-hydroxymyristoyl] glucosamine N-acyltransferase
LPRSSFFILPDVDVTLTELAQLTDGTIVRGKLDAVYGGMEALDLAGPGDVSFLGNAKYATVFAISKAGVCLVEPGERGGSEDMALIEVVNPTLAFSAVIAHFSKAEAGFSPGIHPAAHIDATAVLDPTKVCIHAGAVVMAGAVIGDGTEIYPNVVIGVQARVGRDCLIYQNVSIRERCVLGDRVILQPGVVIGSDGYGYQFHQGRHQKIPQVGIVEIGDDVEVGANTCIDRARFGKTLIGEGTKIDNLVQIGHNVQIGKHCIVIALTGIAGSAKLGNYVTCAAQVGIAGHFEVGDKAVLAARTAVTNNLLGSQTYLGNPAQPMKDELKNIAMQRRLPKIVEEIKELKRKIQELES